MSDDNRQPVERQLACEQQRIYSRRCRMRAIEDRVAVMPDLDGRPMEEILYDEYGLLK